MYGMFANFIYNGQKSSLKSIDVSSFDTSSVTNMRNVFSDQQKLTEIKGLENWDTSNVTNMYGMFQGCNSLENLEISHFDTSKVTIMFGTFENCKSLKNLDVSHFDTSNVIDMSAMFSGCTNLVNLDVSHFDTSKVTNMKEMFFGCSSLTSLNISHFDTSKVTNMRNMFSSMASDVIVKVKDKVMQAWVLNTEGCPSSWTRLNVTFDGDVITNKCNTSITPSGGPTSGYRIYYSEYVSYRNGVYTLINPQLFIVGSDTTTLIGKYSTFNSTSTTSSGNIFYITELKSDGAISKYNVATNGECAI